MHGGFPTTSELTMTVRRRLTSCTWSTIADKPFPTHLPVTVRTPPPFASTPRPPVSLPNGIGTTRSRWPLRPRDQISAHVDYGAA